MAAFDGTTFAVGTWVVVEGEYDARQIQAVGGRDYGKGWTASGYYVVNGGTAHHAQLREVTCTNDLNCRIPRDAHPDHC